MRATRTASAWQVDSMRLQGLVALHSGSILAASSDVTAADAEAEAEADATEKEEEDLSVVASIAAVGADADAGAVYAVAMRCGDVGAAQKGGGLLFAM